MKLTVDHLDAITGSKAQNARKVALCAFMNGTAASCSDIMVPHRLAAFLAETMHESGNLRYVSENMNYSADGLLKTFRKYFTAKQATQYARKPSKIGARVYANRMGNGDEASGDGWKYRGRDIIQITGRDNYVAMTKWIQGMIPGAPDFGTNPDKFADPKWLGLGALWYWTVRVPSKYVEAGNREMIRRRINGGLNGYSDTLKKYDRAALVLLGFEPTDVHAFQMKRPELINDGVSGPATRASLHEALVSAGEGVEAALPPVRPDAPKVDLSKTPVCKKRWWNWKRKS